MIHWQSIFLMSYWQQCLKDEVCRPKAVPGNHQAHSWGRMSNTVCYFNNESYLCIQSDVVGVPSC